MSKLCKLFLGAALAMPVAAQAQDAMAGKVMAEAASAGIQGGGLALRAKLIELDMASRYATLLGPAGRIVTVRVPDEVKNLDQVSVGDDVVVRYMAATAVKIEAASSSGIRERVEKTAMTHAMAGAMPAVGAGRSVQVLADVTAVDVKQGTVTLRGARRTVTVAAPEGLDLGKLKVGESVKATFFEAAAISVEQAEK